MHERTSRTAGPDPEEPLRALLEALATQADLLARYLERVYEESFLETADQGGQLMLRFEGPFEAEPDRLQASPDDPGYVVTTDDHGAAGAAFGDGVEGRHPLALRRGVTVEYRRGSGQVSLRVGRERSDVKSDVVAATGPTGTQVVGIHRALVVDANDPLERGRLLLRIPSLTGDATYWALPCFAPGAGSVPGAGGLPGAGKVVWVLFEGGDLELPVWLGSVG